MDLGSGGWREDEDRFGREYRGSSYTGEEGRRFPSGERAFSGFSGSAGYGGRGFDEQGYGRGAYGASGNERGAYGAYGNEQGWGRDRWESRGGEDLDRMQPSGFMNRTDWRGKQDDWRSHPAENRYGQSYGDWRNMQGGRGQFAGKGPRNYRRSDERIREEVCDALTRDPEVDATDIEVKVESGIVTLTGNVDDRRQKRMAESCAERVDGVHDVNNQLRVHGREDPAGKGNLGRSTTEGSAGRGKGKTPSERNA